MRTRNAGRGAFADRLAAIRKFRGITPAELARRCGVSASTVGRYENGKMEATLSNIQMLAEALGVSWALFDDPDLNNIPLRRAIALDTLRIYARTVNMSVEHRSRLQSFCGLDEAPTTVEGWTAFDVLRRAYDRVSAADEPRTKQQLQLVRPDTDRS